MRSTLITALVALTLTGSVGAVAVAAPTGGGGHGGGSGGGSAHGGGSGARGGSSSYGAHGIGYVSGYAIHVGAGRGGQGAPGLKVLSRSAASAIRVANQTRAPRTPPKPRIQPVSELRDARQTEPFNLYCSHSGDDMHSFADGCPGAIKSRDIHPGSVSR